MDRRRFFRGADDEQEHAGRAVLGERALLFLGHGDAVDRAEGKADKADSDGELRVHGNDGVAAEPFAQRDIERLPGDWLPGDSGDSQQAVPAAPGLREGADSFMFLAVPDSGVRIRPERPTGEPGRPGPNAYRQNHYLEDRNERKDESADWHGVRELLARLQAHVCLTVRGWGQRGT